MSEKEIITAIFNVCVLIGLVCFIFWARRDLKRQEKELKEISSWIKQRINTLEEDNKEKQFRIDIINDILGE